MPKCRCVFLAVCATLMKSMLPTRWEARCLDILIVVAAVGSVDLAGTDLTAYWVSHAFDAGTMMLVLTLLIAFKTIVPAARRRDIIDRDQRMPVKSRA